MAIEEPRRFHRRFRYQPVMVPERPRTAVGNSLLSFIKSEIAAGRPFPPRHAMRKALGRSNAVLCRALDDLKASGHIWASPHLGPRGERYWQLVPTEVEPLELRRDHQRRGELPPRRAKVWVFIKSEIAAGRPFPDADAIRAFMGYRHKAQATDALYGLVIDGYLEMAPRPLLPSGRFGPRQWRIKEESGNSR